MIKNRNSLFIIIALLVFLGACKKDEEQIRANQITLNGENFELSKGIIESYGHFMGEEAYNFDVILLSSGFIVHELNGEPDSVSGIGNALVMEFYSSDSTDLAVGEYTYNPLRAAFSCDYAEAALDFNTETEEGIELEISGGTITVSKNGITYEFSFSFETYEGENLSGYYQGSLTHYDYTSPL